MAYTVVIAPREMAVTELLANVAVSLGPFGMVLGLQLLGTFQRLLLGVADQVALPL